MSISRWPHREQQRAKDPDATLDYLIDWSDWLGDGEVIVASTWEVVGATVELSSFTDTTATVWISGGEAGETIWLTNRITTDSIPIARVDERTLILPVREK